MNILRLIYAYLGSVSRLRSRSAYNLLPMPELPEVEVLRRSLEPWLTGLRIRRVEVYNGDLREARHYARRVRELYPNVELDDMVRLVPDKDPSLTERFKEGLRLAGI